MKRAVVVGGGPCGLVTVRRLRESLGPNELSITLITKDKYHYFPPLFADLALNEVKLDEIRAPAENIAKIYKTDFVLDEVVDVDPANRKVKTKGGKEFGYDYLVVCAGVRNAPEVVPGLAEHGYHAYALEDALRMKEALKNFKGGRILFLVPEFPFRCPGYPFELAGKLAYLAKRKGYEVKIDIALPAPMEEIVKAMQDIAMTAYYIHTKEFDNIKYLPAKKPKEVKDGKVVFDDGSEEPYDLLLYGPPSRPQKAFEKDEFLCRGDKRWMAAVFPTFRNPNYDDVFVPTDASMPCVGLPPAGVNVHEAAVAAADAIVADVTGIKASIPFPKQVPLVADFGVTGLLIVFEILGERNGKALTKKYVALTSPLIKNMKLSFYLGWIGSLKV